MSETAKPYVRKKAVTTISLTEQTMDYARQQAQERGMPLSSFIEQLIRQERERVEHPSSLSYLAKDANGDLVAIPIRNA